MLHKLRHANNKRQAEWDADGVTDTPTWRAMELGGEAGELLNEVKKLERERCGVKGSRTTMTKFLEELADVYICADLLASSLGVGPTFVEDAIIRKFNATSEKVGLKTRL